MSVAGTYVHTLRYSVIACTAQPQRRRNDRCSTKSLINFYLYGGTILVNTTSTQIKKWIKNWQLLAEVVSTEQHGKWATQPIHSPIKPQKATWGTSRISATVTCTSSIIIGTCNPSVIPSHSNCPSTLLWIQLRGKVYLTLCTYTSNKDQCNEQLVHKHHRCNTYYRQQNNDRRT